MPIRKPASSPFQTTPQVSFNFWSQPVYQNAKGELYTPGIDGNTYATNPWDYLYLGVPTTNPYTPGLCEVIVDKGRAYDKKKSAGTDGARVTYHGTQLGTVTVKIRIWTPEQLKQLGILWPLLFPPNYKGDPPSYDTQHPALKLYSIKALQFTKGSGPVIDSRGVGTFTMEALEFAKPGKKNATHTNDFSDGSIFDVGAKDYPTPGSDPRNLGP